MRSEGKMTKQALSKTAERFRADLVIELPQYVSEQGTLNCFYRARVLRGLILDKYHSQGTNEPYLAGTYRVSRSKKGPGSKFAVWYALRGYPKMPVPAGPIRDEIILIARMISRLDSALMSQK